MSIFLIINLLLPHDYEEPHFTHKFRTTLSTKQHTKKLHVTFSSRQQPNFDRRVQQRKSTNRRRLWHQQKTPSRKTEKIDLHWVTKIGKATPISSTRLNRRYPKLNGTPTPSHTARDPITAFGTVDVYFMTTMTYWSTCWNFKSTALAPHKYQRNWCRLPASKQSTM